MVCWAQVDDWKKLLGVRRQRPKRLCDTGRGCVYSEMVGWDIL